MKLAPSPLRFAAVSKPGPALVAALERLLPATADGVFQLASAAGPGPVLTPQPHLWREFLADPADNTLVVHPVGDEHRVLSMRRLTAPHNPTSGLIFLEGVAEAEDVDPRRWARGLRAFADNQDLIYSRLETSSLSVLNTAMIISDTQWR